MLMSAPLSGLSWLIGTTMQEIIGAWSVNVLVMSVPVHLIDSRGNDRSIFLFVKHPFDVGDRVDFE
jgi:hypothetical protein